MWRSLAVLLWLAAALHGQVISRVPNTITGASAVAAGQVLYGTGAGVAGSEAGFTYAAAGNRQLTVSGSFGAIFQAASSVNNVARLSLSQVGITNWQFDNTATSGMLTLGSSAGNALAIPAVTRNLLIGTTTDGNFKFDVASSGSSGTARFYDQTPTTGSTSLIVRAGAGQGTNNLITWQSAAGSTLSYVRGDNGGFYGQVVALDVASYALSNGAGLDLANNRFISFSSTAAFFGTKDLTLDRQAAGVLRISATGTTGGGLLIEGLKSTTGEVFVCVDTTGRFVRSATACVGTI